MLHHPCYHCSLVLRHLFCDLVITSKEARNNISVSAMETFNKDGGIADRWSKVKPVSSRAKNYELV